MSNHIVDFISAAVQDKPAAAANAFRDEIEDRIDAKLGEFQETIRQNMFGEAKYAKKMHDDDEEEVKEKKDKDHDEDEDEDELDEQFSSWDVTVTKPINKLKKGQQRTVKARTAGEAMKKAASAMGEPTLGGANLEVKRSAGMSEETDDVELDEAKKAPPTDATIRKHINWFSTADDPYYVAQRIGKMYDWSQREIERAEQIIKKKYIK